MSAITDEPATLQQALSDPNWHNAMNEEYSVLIKKQDVALGSFSYYK
jgi:hypothetical protein